MPKISLLPKILCRNAYFVKATNDCAKGYACKLDKDNKVYPTSCAKGSDKDCWRVKYSK